MAKRLLNISILCLLLAFACLFFPVLNIDLANAAAIEGVPGNKIVMTGIAGKTPEHFFLDDSGESTLVNAKTKQFDGKYYYSIVSSGGNQASGFGEFSPTTDIKALIEKGLVYAQASATISSEDDTQVEITISSGEEAQSARISNGDLSTPLLKLSDISQNIRFSFKTIGKDNDFVMDEPTIHLYTAIQSVTLEAENQIVCPGQMIKIDAYNDVTKISGITGNFVNFSKINHEIKYQFDAGEQYVKIVGSNFVISNDAPDGAEIIFRAYSNKNSYSSEKIYSQNSVTFIVDSEYINVSVRTDFENAATISGEGKYFPDKRVTLRIDTHEGYEFLGWYVDGEYKNNDTKLITTATFGKDIYAKFRKNISIKEISIASRVYDGTTNIDNDLIQVSLNGVELGHEVGVTGLEFEYYDPNAGQNKLAFLTKNELQLTGKDKDIYNISDIMPPAYGVVTKRAAKVMPEKVSKQYGNVDTIIGFSTFNVVEGETLLGSLSRADGEEIGQYPILLGDLPARNPNYDLVLEEESWFEITPRVLYLDNIEVSEKEYDATTAASISAALRNIYNGEDVYALIEGEFVTPDAGANVEVKITKVTLQGEDNQNYVLEDYDQQIFGTIHAKEVSVTAKACTKTYGDEDVFEYTTQGVLFDDTFSGKLAISNQNVGDHKIELGTLSNPNYVIANFESAICTITPRTLYVDADRQTKVFGDADPDLTYKTKNLVFSDTLDGSLERDGGDDVGEYAITLGTLSNPNYEIVFTGNVLQITQREIDVEIKFNDKEYDGNTDVEWNVEYKNNITGAPFVLNLNAKLDSVDCGTAHITFDSPEIEYEKKDNFVFDFIFLNSSIQITKRNVNIFVSNSSKTYGENDPKFSYTTRNLIDGDLLYFEIDRKAGENVGQYDFIVNETAENTNYTISLINTYFEIVPKQMSVAIDNISKPFGDKDPEIGYKITDEFCFDDDEKIIDGKILRQEGESVGVYTLDLSKMSSNENYIFVNVNDAHFIILKRQVDVIIQEATKTYGDDDPRYSCTIKGEVNGEPLSVEISREFGEDVGQYQLYCATKDPRYDINCVGAILYITPRDITVKADEKVKIYGDDDPLFSVSVTEGLLKNNDSIEDISTGKMIRKAGEQVGTYEITRGDFSFGANYNLTFESGNLTIIKRRITISALAGSKTYGDVDAMLQYQISGQGLAFSDKVEGSLSRDDGENVGTYDIHRGDLSLNENYEVTFVENVFKISPREIEVVPVDAFKQYGEPDEEIKYQIVGQMMKGDTLEGCLFREKSKEKNENVGKYLILSSLENPNYKISFSEHYFSILPREITIEIASFEINYGDKEPELTYKITSGSILDGDVMQGGLYRISGNSVGVYDIISTLSLGRNYEILFEKATVTILPLHLTIQSKNYTKTYGQEDPAFDYEIVDGKLINDDKLYGAITREAGEDIGTYKLIKNVYNSNYEITMLPAQLQIFKKDVYLFVSVADKIYDGTTSAFIKNAYVSGIAKDVYLQYDRYTSAEFVSPELGTDKEVTLKDFYLSGDKAGNYNLIYPSQVLADIALGSIEGDDVVISTADPVLEQDYTLKYQSKNIENSAKIDKYRLTFVVDIWVEKDGERVDPKGLFTINMNVPENVFIKNNIYVFKKDQSGYSMITCQKGENGEIEVMSDGLGEFYVVIEDETWLNYAAYISISVIAIVSIACVLMICFKRKKTHKINF